MAFNKIFGPGGRAVGPDPVFDGDNAVVIFAEWSIDDAMVVADMAVDDGLVLLLHGAIFEGFAEFAGGGSIFRDQDDAAGFTVQPIDQIGSGVLGLESGVWRIGFGVWGLGARAWDAVPRPQTRDPRPQIQSGAADEARHLTVLGGMTDEAGRFVDHQQVGVFMDDIQHAGMILKNAFETTD